MTVNLIWLQFDVDRSGDLDKTEAFLFTQEVLKTLEPDYQLSEYIFDLVFKKFDTD